MKRIEAQLARLYYCWLKYTMNDERSAVELNRLFEFLPKDVRSKVWEQYSKEKVLAK